MSSWQRYHIWEKFGQGENRQIWQIVNYSLKFSSPILTDTLKIYLAYALTVAYLSNFSLPMAFTCMACQKRYNFPVYGILLKLLRHS